MQKGKAVHRRGGRPVAVFCLAVFAVVTCGSASAEAGMPECFAVRFSEVAPDADPGCVRWRDLDAGERLAGFVSTVSNPYLLDGLVASRLSAGCEAKRYSAWLEWSHLGHSLYREDHLEMILGFSLPLEGCRFAIVPAVEQREVRGLGAARAHSCRVIASYGYAGCVSVGFARSAYESVPGAAPSSGAFLLCRAGSLALALDRSAPASCEAETRLSIEARCAARCSVRFGYRWGTEELSGGLVVPLASVIVDCAWSQHPVLGSSLSIGIGRFWEW